MKLPATHNRHETILVDSQKYFDFFYGPVVEASGILHKCVFIALLFLGVDSKYRQSVHVCNCIRFYTAPVSEEVQHDKVLTNEHVLDSLIHWGSKE